MKKDHKLLEFLKFKSDVIDNLKAIQLNLSRATDEGMVDLEDDLYNQLLGLIDQASVSENWDEMREVIYRGKTLEADVDTFLSEHGQSTLSLPWPCIPEGK